MTTGSGNESFAHRSTTVRAPTGPTDGRLVPVYPLSGGGTIRFEAQVARHPVRADTTVRERGSSRPATSPGSLLPVNHRAASYRPPVGEAPDGAPPPEP